MFLGKGGSGLRVFFLIAPLDCLEECILGLAISQGEGPVGGSGGFVGCQGIRVGVNGLVFLVAVGLRIDPLAGGGEIGTGPSGNDILGGLRLGYRFLFIGGEPGEPFFRFVFHGVITKIFGDSFPLFRGDRVFFEPGGGGFEVLEELAGVESTEGIGALAFIGIAITEGGDEDISVVDIDAAGDAGEGVVVFAHFQSVEDADGDANVLLGGGPDHALFDVILDFADFFFVISEPLGGSNGILCGVLLEDHLQHVVILLTFGVEAFACFQGNGEGGFGVFRGKHHGGEADELELALFVDRSVCGDGFDEEAELLRTERGHFLDDFGNFLHVFGLIAFALFFEGLHFVEEGDEFVGEVVDFGFLGDAGALDAHAVGAEGRLGIGGNADLVRLGLELDPFGGEGFDFLIPGDGEEGGEAEDDGGDEEGEFHDRAGCWYLFAVLGEGFVNGPHFFGESGVLEVVEAGFQDVIILDIKIGKFPGDGGVLEGFGEIEGFLEIRFQLVSPESLGGERLRDEWAGVFRALFLGPFVGDFVVVFIVAAVLEEVADGFFDDGVVF